MLASVALPYASACHADAPRAARAPELPVQQLGVLASEEDAPFLFEGIEEGLAVATVSANAFAFLDYRGRRVVLLDTTGHVVRYIGRGGGAPGELRFPQSLVRIRKGIGVVDGQKNALVTFDTGGRALGDFPLDTLLGVPAPRLTGLRQLDNGDWAYSVVEHDAGRRSEALYLRRGRHARLLARTAVAATHPMMTPCRVELPSEAPVFWPTMRWDAIRNDVAFASGEDYRIVVWRATSGDSTVFTLPVPPSQAREADALELPIGVEVHAGGADCTLSRQDALRQRGMARVRPAIARIALGPSGVLCARLTVPSASGVAGYRHVGTSIDSLPSIAFPSAIAADGRFVAVERSRDGAARLVRWQWR